MENVQELHAETSAPSSREEQAGVQPCGYLLELSLDWIVLRASENVHKLLGESHVTVVDEPFGRFVQSQALHDLRNLFSRLSGTTGIGRAYGVRLTDERDRVDVAFQLSDGRVLLEAVPSSGAFGEAFGTVGGLIAGLANHRGQALLDGGARRMRALTGYDRVTLVCGDQRAESSRGAFSSPADMSVELPALVGDTEAAVVALFPREPDDSSAAAALMRAPPPPETQDFRAAMRVLFTGDGFSGEFRCDHRGSRQPSFELHAAAELFAQSFAARLEIDRLKG